MRSHADRRTGQAIQHAIHTGGGAGTLTDLFVTGGEHSLPDVLADEDAEEVDQEVSDDGVPANGSQLEAGRWQFGHQGVPTTGLVQAHWQQDEHQADGLDHELDDIGQGQRPHAADGRVQHYHAAAEHQRSPERQVQQHLQDGGHGQGRGDPDHQRVSQHDDGAGLACGGVVALFQYLGHGEDAQAQQRFGEEQVDGDDAQAQGCAQPEAGDAVDVAQAHGADGGSATEHGGGHGAHVQDRAEVAPGHQVVLVGFRAPHAIPAKPEHAGGVDHYNNDVQGHWGSPDYLYYGEIDRAGVCTAPGGLFLCWRASVALPHGSCRGRAVLATHHAR
ncbi:hypothetical protein D3C79_651220 [compost metagenome]